MNDGWMDGLIHAWKDGWIKWMDEMAERKEMKQMDGMDRWDDA